MKSTAEIKKYAVDMTKANIDKKFKHKTCQFSQKNRGGQRYCTLTTNKSCTNCSFYDPTIQTVFESLAKEIERAQTAKKTFDQRSRQLKGLIKKCKSIEADMDRMKTEANREYNRVYIAKYDMVQLWQDSVNTYE